MAITLLLPHPSTPLPQLPQWFKIHVLLFSPLSSTLYFWIQ